MRYLKFRILNFKGIKEANIDLRSMTGANVFSLVGLNESGKTTILEAIHSFSPDYLTNSLRKTKSKTAADSAKDRLPRHLLARFTGSIIVEATVEISEKEKSDIADDIRGETGIFILKDDLPDTFTLCRSDVFERGDYVDTTRRFGFELKGKRQGDRKRKVISGDDYNAVYDCLWGATPDIAYYDSFIFDFPKRIYLTNRPGAGSWVYRKMFEDVLAAGKVKYKLDDIVRRIQNDHYKRSWLEFFIAWSEEDEKSRVQQIIDQASNTITESVFGKWNKIFGEDVGDKEISVEFGVEEGRVLDKSSKSYLACDNHDLYISLQIKQGTRRFPIQDRSLGFRWFFAFLLFTQFRTKRSEFRPVLFLFDEPAANLHSAAQERLIESFPEIATGNNMLLYTTHSHYMISPDWLEQTFIVTNAADAPGVSMVDSAIIDDEFLDIKAQRYRDFANAHPSETSYFQPIMDRLEVRPSRFDASLPSVVLEGKSDYYLLRYASILLDCKNVRLIPATGSGTFSALIGLGAAWGTKFVFLLDSDNAGIKERARYALDHGARAEAICCLRDFDDSLSDIESLLDTQSRELISTYLKVERLSKKTIMRFFQEQLAKRDIFSLGSGFEQRAGAVLLGLNGKIESL
ncbi:ATP-binding protein [Sphingomonas sp. S1-29]|uniref:AAA family ATPase n=1 Tax=Sphingomonas sp. S1-29 TaxID=2991074 RepID=UPI00223ED09C|nr:AAA family ATPase [Sphingomonas sp. S1-29]UZK68255.1 ATP-binding protein [Sphingomonas sp. S1-29]